MWSYKANTVKYVQFMVIAHSRIEKCLAHVLFVLIYFDKNISF